MKTAYKGRLGQALVLMAGYDDEGSITPDIDAIMAESRPRRCQRGRDHGNCGEPCAEGFLTMYPGPCSTAPPEASTINYAAVSPGSKGFLSVAACGTTTGTSILNTSPGEPTANAAVAAPNPNGSVCFTPSLSTHIIADISGFFVSD